MFRNNSFSFSVIFILALTLLAGSVNVYAFENARAPEQVNSSIRPDNLEGLNHIEKSKNVGPRRDVAYVEGKFLLIHGPYDERDNWWGDVEDIFAAAELDYDRIDDPSELEDIDLCDYDVVWVGDYQEDEWNEDFNDYMYLIEEWLEECCGVLYHCTGTNNFDVKPVHPGGLTYANGEHLVGTAYTAATQADCFLFDLMGWSYNTVLTGGYFSHTYYDAADLDDVSGGDYQVLVTDEMNGVGEVLIARYAYGNGQVVVSGTTDGNFNWGWNGWEQTDPEIFAYLMSLIDPLCCAEDYMIDMFEYINRLIEAGELSINQANFMLSGLYRAQGYLESGNANYFIRYLLDFCRRVATLVWWGVLTPEEGQYLCDIVGNILECIGYYDVEAASLSNLLSEVEENAPQVFNIQEAYPNPFNSTATVSYNLPLELQVSLDVYNLSGRRVASLVDGVQQAGAHSVTLHADNLSSGTYIVLLNAGGKVLSQKVTLIR